MGLPDLASKAVEHLAAAEAAPPAPDAPAAPAETPAAAAPAAPATPAAPDVSRATDGKPAVSSIVAGATPPGQGTPTELAGIAKLISEKGPKAVLDALPEEARIALGKQLYPRLHRTLNERTDLGKADVQTIFAALERTGRNLDEFRDEVMTAGLDDAGRARYKAEKAERQRAAAAAAASASAPTAAQIAVRDERYNTVWGVIRDAGLPLDKNDPDVRKVWADILDEASPLYHEPDFNTVVAHVRSSATSLASKRQKPGQAPAGTAPEGFISRSDAERLARDAADQALRDAGVLTADTGRPGGGSGAAPAPPKTMAEALASSKRRLEEAARI